MAALKSEFPPDMQLPDSCQVLSMKRKIHHF